MSLSIRWQFKTNGRAHLFSLSGLRILSKRNRKGKTADSLEACAGNSTFERVLHPKLTQRPQKWYESIPVPELPSYVYWPDEKRFAKVLWWGRGKDGLYFIEKGFGYRFADHAGDFRPASEAGFKQEIGS